MARWCWLFLLCVLIPPGAARGADGNRLVYLDAFLDPYYVHRDFPKLTTPQWVGEDGVECVVVLAIDDMNESARYEAFLRPILDRLQAIDGRAGVSIMTNRANPNDPQLGEWLEEGLSIEVHTYDHPCPCLQGSNFDAARRTYDQCVDLMASIPGNRPIAFRMPCCDSLNTPSPRFWAEIFNKTTPQGNYLTIDSSVFQVFTSADPDLEREWVIRDDGQERFRHYIPFPSYVNTIENYPYPYVIGRLCWQFPCMVPSDWEAQHVQRPNNPDTVRDWKYALDATVRKQGVFNLVFHPHNWIRAEQVVELIDHAVAKHGTKVKFLSFREANDRLNQFLLAGQPLRDEQGNDNGIRVLDVNNDGYLDVVIGNDHVRETRIWNPAQNKWDVIAFPLQFVTRANDGTRNLGAHFGVDRHGHVFVLQSNEQSASAWHLDAGRWVEEATLLAGLDMNGQLLRTSINGIDQGVRLHDLDSDGTCELLVGNAQHHYVLRHDGQRWQDAGFRLPDDVSIVNQQGGDAGLRLIDIDGDQLDDIVFSNTARYSVHLMRMNDDGTLEGWTVTTHQANRGEGDAVPMIVREGTNNGAWFHSQHLWIQNEDTSRLPDHVDRRSFAQLLGEHADIPPPRSPEQSLRSMHVAPGMKVELVASEPLVMDPVAFDWDDQGRLWVVEMGDYPLGVGPEGEPGGRVKMLVDENGDGRYDKAHLFLDGLSYPNGIKSWRNGVLVTCAPEIFYAADTDDDGRADVRTTLFQGFVEGNQQHRANGMRWGLDNWLYIANGDSGGIIESLATGERVPIGGRDLRIQPDTGRLDAQSGQTQFGRDRDDWGNWFGGNNSNPLWHYVLPDHYLRRNPHWAPPDSRRDVPAQPGAAPVFPRSRTLARFNDFNMTNRFTSACSPTFYRDTLLGEQFAGNAFICEPVHNLVHRELVQPDGVSFRSVRAPAEVNSEFLASDDNWFRPVMVRTGPDGALWVCDMYRLVIEHPEWIPQSWQQRLDLRAGADRGRIYRIYPADVQPRPALNFRQMDTAALIAQLASDNGWVRDMAQQVVLWRGDRKAIELCRELFRASTNPLARLHALCTLDGLDALDDKLLTSALSDPHPQLRRHAVRLAGARLRENLDLLDALLPRTDDPDPTVRLELLFALGEAPAATPIGAIAARHRDDPYMVAAFISSLRSENLTAALDDLLASSDANVDAPPPQELIRPIINYAAATENSEALATLIERITVWPDPVGADQQLERGGTEQQRVWRLDLLADLIAALAPESRTMLPAAQQEPVKQSAELARRTLAADDAPLAEQLAAIRLLSVANWQKDEVLRELEALLSPSEAAEIQSAAVEGLARYSDTDVATRLLANWRSHSPVLRAQILDTLLMRTTWTAVLLDAIESGTVPAGQLDAVRQQQLLQHRSPALRERATQLLAATRPSDRLQVLQQFRMSKQLTGDTGRGRVLFDKHCSSCHRLEGIGHAVGPDLAALSDRSFDALSVAILDPNRAVEDKFLEYIAVLNDGRQQQGMLANESTNSITLIGKEAKEIPVLRSELESLTATGNSLMPVGLEKDITVQDLADLVAYLQTIEGEPKTFAGNAPKIAHVRDDGSIRMLATDCRIYGPTVVFEELYRNLGFWASPEDRAVWDIEVPREGRYEVVLDYACDDESAGNRFVLTVAGQSVAGRVEGTAGWDNYRHKNVGAVHLPAGPARVTFRSDGPINFYLIDLRGIVLDPVEE